MAVIHMYYIYMGKMMSIYSLVVYNATQYNVRSIYAPNHAFAKKKTKENRYTSPLKGVLRKMSLLIVETLHVKTDTAKIHRTDCHRIVDIALLAPSQRTHGRSANGAPVLALLLPVPVQEIQTRPKTPAPPHRHRSANVHPRDPTLPRKPLRRVLDKHPPLVCRIRARRCPRGGGRGRALVLVGDGIDREPFTRTEDSGDGVDEGVADVGRDGPLVGERETVVVCDDGVCGRRFGWGE